MHLGRTIFSQLMDRIPQYIFKQIVARYDGDYRVRRFNCWQQFLAMAFAQLTFQESLRDIEICLQSLGRRRYHNGFRTVVPHSTLADANRERPWEIYRDLALYLIDHARMLYRDERLALADIDSAIYALDSTIIDLCLSLYPWAKGNVYQKTNAGIKVHTQFDVQAQLPVTARVTAANVHDSRMLAHLTVEPGAFYLLDRAFMDFFHLNRIHRQAGFFIIRAKDHLRFRRITSRPVDGMTGLRADQTIMLVVTKSRSLYPDQLRRVRLYDASEERTLIFLTNNFELDALTICNLYKARWHIELFFRWIKQHLRIKAFFGTSLNAVQTQVWIATAMYVLVAIVKKECQTQQHSLHNILQILGVNLFEPTPLNQLLMKTQSHDLTIDTPNQLKLFEF